jgi:hypothetical protein
MIVLKDNNIMSNLNNHQRPTLPLAYYKKTFLIRVIVSGVFIIAGVLTAIGSAELAGSSFWFIMAGLFLLWAGWDRHRLNKALIWEEEHTDATEAYAQLSAEDKIIQKQENLRIVQEMIAAREKEQEEKRQAKEEKKRLKAARKNGTTLEETTNTENNVETISEEEMVVVEDKPDTPK